MSARDERGRHEEHLVGGVGQVLRRRATIRCTDSGTSPCHRRSSSRGGRARRGRTDGPGGSPSSTSAGSRGPVTEATRARRRCRGRPARCVRPVAGQGHPEVASAQRAAPCPTVASSATGSLVPRVVTRWVSARVRVSAQCRSSTTRRTGASCARSRTARAGRPARRRPFRPDLLGAVTAGQLGRPFDAVAVQEGVPGPQRRSRRPGASPPPRPHPARRSGQGVVDEARLPVPGSPTMSTARCTRHRGAEHLGHDGAFRLMPTIPSWPRVGRRPGRGGGGG